MLHKTKINNLKIYKIKYIYTNQKQILIKSKNIQTKLVSRLAKSIKKMKKKKKFRTRFLICEQ